MDTKVCIKHNGQEIESIANFMLRERSKEYFIAHELMRELMCQCTVKNVMPECIRLEWDSQPKLVLKVEERRYNKAYSHNCYKIISIKRQGTNGKEQMKLKDIVNFNDTILFYLRLKEN